MAKSVADFLVDLKVDGIKDVNALKGSLRALMGASKITGKSLLDISSAVKQFKTNSKDSVQVIRGQVQALKGLQQQAGINSAAFKKLGQDVALYESKLRSAEAAVAQSRTSFAAARTRFVKRTPGALLDRISQVRAAATAQPFDERGNVNQEFIDQQKELNVLTKVETRLQERLALKIREGNRAKVDSNVENKTAAELQELYGKELNDSASTTAQMSLRLRELKEDFQDLTIGSREYIQALNRISYFEQRVADPFGSAARKQAIRSRLGTQETFGMFAGRDPVQSAIDRRERKRSRRYGGFTGGGLANQPVEASGLFKQIASISGAGPAAELQMMGRSYEQVAQSIRTATAASNGSINSLQAQRTALTQLRAGLDPTTKDFRELGKEIDKVDRKLSKLSKKKFSLKGVAQTAGAVAAGGIFGGAEGAAGALLGAPFGPGGAATGAALGAQASMLRKNIEGYAEYASSVDKSLIALKEIAGNQKNYNILLAQATKVTEQLNVPQEVAIRGITRLSAAVLGAKGNVNDAARAFTQIIIAVKGTAGGAEDVNSALTALVQIFSKGKVSAEELSGQLGERFPAAVTEFAEANEMTTTELQASLKQGTVGLNELMKFLAGVGSKYQKTALKIAQSNEEAGARSTIAFNKMRLAIGRAIKPIGAKLQEAITDFVMDNINALTQLAKSFAEFAQKTLNGLALIIKHGDKIKDLITIIVGGALGGKLLGLVGTILTRLVPLIKRVGLLRTAVLLLNRALLTNPLVLFAAGLTAAGVGIANFAGRHKKAVRDIANGNLTIKESEERIQRYKDQLKELKGAAPVTKPAETPELKQARRDGLPIITGKDLRPTVQSPGVNKAEIEKLEDTIKAGEAALALRKKGEKELEGLFEGLGSGVDFGDLAGDLKGKGKDDGAKDISDAVMIAQINGMREVITLSDVEAKLANDILQINLDDLKTNEKIVAKAQAHFEADQSRLQIQEQLQDLQRDITAQVDNARLALGQITQEEFNQIELQNRKVELEKQLLQLKINGLITDKEAQKIIKTIIDAMAAGQNKTKSFVEGLRELIKKGTNLNDIFAEFGVQTVDKLANSFADFIATGKASFAEFAKSVLQDMSRILAKAAFLKALEFIPGIGKTIKAVTNADGNVFAQNKIIPYARGGIVNKPTMFAYANGGAGSFGIMGEAGAEAILPLRRGPGGKLGVESSGGFGNVVVNVDASGSNVEGSSADASQLGKAIGAAVQSELIKQKRPGGLLAR